MSRMADERFSEWMESLAEGTALIDIQGHEVLELLESMLEDRQRIEELERVLRVCGEAVLCPGNWHDLSPAALNGIAKHVPDFVSRAEAAEAKLAELESNPLYNEKIALHEAYMKRGKMIAELEKELVATKCDWVKRERYHKAKLARVEKDVTDIADRLSDLCWDMHEYGGQHWSGDFSKLIDELKQALADVPNEPEGDLN